MSTSNRPPSPSRPSSASVTTTTASTSPPRSTPLPSTSGSASGAGPASSSSVSSPPPTGLPRPAIAIAAAAAALVPPQAAHRPQQQQHQRLSIPLLLQQQPPPSSSPTLPATLPMPPQTAQITQARDALVASLGNALDTELQSRAGLLHSNQRAIEKQERDVGRALAELRREDEKLMKVLNEGSRKVKELGDVQNWAERLERDFLVVEETMRLVNEGSGDDHDDDDDDGGGGSWSGSGSESGSWSGSESRSESRSEAGDGEGDVRMSDGEGGGDGEADGVDGAATTIAASMDKGKQIAIPSSDAMDVDPVAPSPANHESAHGGGSGSSSIVTAVRAAPDSDTAASPLTSPGASSWLKRFIWRS